MSFVLGEHGLDRIHVFESEERPYLGPTLREDVFDAWHHGELTINSGPKHLERFSHALPRVNDSEEFLTGIEADLIMMSPFVCSLLHMPELGY